MRLTSEQRAKLSYRTQDSRTPRVEAPWVFFCPVSFLTLTVELKQSEALGLGFFSSFGPCRSLTQALHIPGRCLTAEPSPAQQTLEPGLDHHTQLFFFLIFIFTFIHFILFYWDRVSLCPPDFPRTNYVDQASPELTELLLFLPPEYWDLGVHHHTQLIYFICMSGLPTCLPLLEGQKRTSDPLELDLWITVSCQELQVL